MIMRQEELWERAEAILDLIESDFGQSGRDARIEIIYCELDAHKKEIASAKKVCKIYFDIASSVLGEEGVRIRREAIIDRMEGVREANASYESA